MKWSLRTSLHLFNKNQLLVVGRLWHHRIDHQHQNQNMAKLEPNIGDHLLVPKHVQHWPVRTVHGFIRLERIIDFWVTDSLAVSALPASGYASALTADELSTPREPAADWLGTRKPRRLFHWLLLLWLVSHVRAAAQGKRLLKASAQEFRVTWLGRLKNKSLNSWPSSSHCPQGPKWWQLINVANSLRNLE